jgi:acyl-CoA thioesterase FadM
VNEAEELGQVALAAVAGKLEAERAAERLRVQNAQYLEWFEAARADAANKGAEIERLRARLREVIEVGELRAQQRDEALVEVERLRASRARLSHTNVDYHGQIYGELKPEIERLRAEVRKAKDAMVAMRETLMDTDQIVMDRDAEIERLRAALADWERHRTTNLEIGRRAES